MTDKSQEMLDQLKKSELIQKFGIVPSAYVHQLGTRALPSSAKPGPGTHQLSWRDRGHSEDNLYNRATIDLLLGYIVLLEGQLQIEAELFREKSLASLIDNAALDGFTPVGSSA